MYPSHISLSKIEMTLAQSKKFVIVKMKVFKSQYKIENFLQILATIFLQIAKIKSFKIKC